MQGLTPAKPFTMVDYAVGQFTDHYNTERPHQGIDNVRIFEPPEGERPPPADEPTVDTIEVDTIEVEERLGGLLKSYRRAA